MSTVYTEGWTTTKPTLADGCDWAKTSVSSRSGSAYAIQWQLEIGWLNPKQICAWTRIAVAAGDYTSSSKFTTSTNINGGTSLSQSFSLSSYSYSWQNRYFIMSATAGDTVKMNLTANSWTRSSSLVLGEYTGPTDIQLAVFDGSAWHEAAGVCVYKDGAWHEASGLSVRSTEWK